MLIASIKSILESENPLSDDAIDFLFSYHGEDEQIDYKVHFNIESDREWLNITKDFLAFSNTNGGFLIFGIEDATYEKKGLDLKTALYLSDVNKIQQKINRYISPPITHIRSKKIEWNKLHFIVVHIPVSKNCTHIVSLDGTYTNDKQERQYVLRPGMIFIRKSGANSLIDSNSFEELLNRRIDYFKEQLLNKISRVVESPPNHEILVFDPEAKEELSGQKKYRISSSSDAIPVVGMSFTIAPTTDEQLISSWIALSKNDPLFVPRKNQIFRLYARRLELKLTEEQVEWMALYSLIVDAPVFYWLQGLPKIKVVEILGKGFTLSEFPKKITILHVSAFYGRKIFQHFFSLFNQSEVQRLGRISRSYPEYGPTTFFQLNLVGTADFKDLPQKPNNHEEEATKLAERIDLEQDDTLDSTILNATDCKLYSPKYEIKES